jgi:hypothetical protein
MPGLVSKTFQNKPNLARGKEKSKKSETIVVSKKLPGIISIKVYQHVAG